VPVVQRYSEIREALGIVKPRFQPSEHITNFEGPSQAPKHSSFGGDQPHFRELETARRVGAAG
jgi:hypothetical protein